MTTSLSDEAIAELSLAVSNLDKAAEALPDEARDEYRESQESIVQARRSAETHEGLLQIN